MPDFPDPNPVGRDTGLQFTNTFLNSRRMIRTQKNPLDKSTIVSIFPQDIEEIKPTIEPGKFKIKSGTYDNPSTLIIGGSSWWKDYDVEQPMLEIVVSSIQLADSIVKDYCNGMLGCDMDGSMPGLFFVLGETSPLEIRTKYKKKMDEMKTKQDRWFHILVKLADSLWARTNGNPLVIWDVMRLAALELNLKDKPWIKDFTTSELVRCKFCGGMRNSQFPICPVCKAIDPTHPLAKDVKFAI